MARLTPWAPLLAMLALGGALGAVDAVWGGSVAFLVAAAAVGILGLPHGASDWEVARQIWESRWSGRLAGLFALLYLGTAGVVLATWLVFPAFSLALFLAASAWHFGALDVPPSNHPARRLEVTLRGALPIALPAAVHPGEVGAAFETLAAGSGAWVAAPGSVVLWGMLAGMAVIGTALLRPTSLVSHAELGVLVLLALLLPPVSFFAAYFCGVHAPRHFQSLSRRGYALPWTAPSLWLSTLAPLALGGVVLWSLLPALAPEPAVLRVVFIGLAALTAPHMALAARADQTRRPSCSHTSASNRSSVARA